MSTENLVFETIVREFLEKTQKHEDGEIFVLLIQYLGHLYEDEEEEVLLEDFSSYEVDDFLNFYLEDQFPGDKNLISKSRKVLKEFLKFLVYKKYIDANEEKEWKVVLN